MAVNFSTLNALMATLLTAIKNADTQRFTATANSASMGTAATTIAAAQAAVEAYIITAGGLDADLFAQRAALYQAIFDGEAVYSAALAAASALGGTHWPVI